MTEQPEIFFSYAWGDEKEEGESREKIVNELYQSLKNDGFTVIRDKYDLGYRGSISGFMERIGEGRNIIVAISQKYLQSPYCMFELYEIARNNKFDKELFAQHVLPLIVEWVDFGRPEVIDAYITHWKTEWKKWEALVKKHAADLSTEQFKRFQQVKNVKNHFGELAGWLADMNSLNPQLIAQDNFAIIKKAITQAATTMPVGTAAATTVKTATTNSNNKGAPIAQQFINSNVQITYGEKQIPKYLSTPFFPELFMGREADLEAVYQQFCTPGHLPLLLVNGEGGIGKTSLAAQYYLLHQAQYQHLAWVFAEDSLADALLALAGPLQLGFDNDADTAQRLQILLAALKELKAPCLLVIDNANKLDDLNYYYPLLRQCPNCHVLLTTRVTELKLAAAFYKIAPFDEAAALEIFIRHYPAHDRTEDGLFVQLYQAVGGNTLVLELLAKNLRHSNRLARQYSLATLLADLQASLLALGHSEIITTGYRAKGDAPQSGRAEAIMEAMYNLGELNNEERALLAMFAVLPAENILYATLQSLLPKRTDLQPTLLTLAAKGWLDYNEAAGSFKVSPVVQEITRAKNTDLLGDCGDLITALIDKLDYEAGTGHLLNASYAEALLYARYAEILLKHITETDNDLYLLLDGLGSYHTATGNLPRAMQWYQEGYDRIQQLCQAYPTDTVYKNNLAVAYSKLGDTHGSLGDLSKALSYYEDATVLCKELYEAHPDNVGFKNGLGVAYSKLGETHSSLGNLPKALGYYEERLRLGKELYEAHPDNVGFKNGLAIAYGKLGETHGSLGDLSKALSYYEDATVLFKELYEAHPDNVGFKNGLGVAYSKLGETHSSLGNLPKALGYYEERLRLGKELYEAYPDNVGFKNGLAVSYINLGLVYEEQKDTVKANSLYQQAKDIWQQLSNDFPAYVEFTKNLKWVNSKLA